MNVIDFATMGAAGLILIGYVIYFLYISKRQQQLNKEKWLGKIKDTMSNLSSPEKDDLSLIKATPDTYFKSKIPKIVTLETWLQHAGLEINSSAFILISLLIGLFFAAIIFVFLNANILSSILVGATTGLLLPWTFVAFLTNQRKKKFLDDFPAALDIMRRALKAGHSMERSLSMVAEQQSGVVGESFKKMMDSLRIGQPFEEVLTEMSNRIGIDDFRLLAIVIVLQRETGGSLSEAMNNFAQVIRARQTLRKRVKSLTAEVRMTAIILTSIPFFIFGAIYVTTPSYFDPLFYTETGKKLFLFGILMLFIGIFIIYRMSHKEYY